MLVNYTVYSHAPDGIWALGQFETFSNAQCFMYAWCGRKYPENGYDDVMELIDDDGWKCYIVRENDWLDIVTEDLDDYRQDEVYHNRDY